MQVASLSLFCAKYLADNSKVFFYITNDVAILAKSHSEAIVSIVNLC